MTAMTVKIPRPVNFKKFFSLLLTLLMIFDMLTRFLSVMKTVTYFFFQECILTRYFNDNKAKIDIDNNNRHSAISPVTLIIRLGLVSLMFGRNASGQAKISKIVTNNQTSK